MVAASSLISWENTGKRDAKPSPDNKKSEVFCVLSDAFPKDSFPSNRE